MYKEKIVDIETGEETWRDYTPEQIAEAEAMQQKVIEAAEKLQIEAEKKAAALAKLSALGLDEDDLKALGL